MGDNRTGQGPPDCLVKDFTSTGAYAHTHTHSPVSLSHLLENYFFKYLFSSDHKVYTFPHEEGIVQDGMEVKIKTSKIQPP